jgi:flagellar hook-length control protein FliK
MGAAAAFDALIGGAVDADARPTGAMRAGKDAGAPGAKPDQSVTSPPFAQRDVRFSAELADQEAGAGAAAGLIPLAINDQDWTPPAEGMASGRSAKTPAGSELVQQEASTGTDADTPAEAAPDLQNNAGAIRPAQPAPLADEAVKVDADRASVIRNPGVGEQPVSLESVARDSAGAPDAVRTPAAAPEKAVMPDAARPAAPRPSDAPAFEAVVPADAPALTKGQAAPAPQPSDGAPQPDTDPELEAATGADVKAAAGTPEPAQAPVPEAPANAASVRREGDTRRTAKSADDGKPGDAPAKPTQSGAKAPPPSAPQAAAPANPGGADMPAPPRSADAFQALLQAQTRPGGETAVPRAPDLPLDTSGDAALRSSPDRAAELLRSSAPVNTGAPPRFAPQTVQTLAAQIVRRQGEGGRVFDIRLDPPELGRVGVRLEMGRDQMVKAMLSAERPDTLQELQRTARDLERALAEAGLTLAENGLSFSLSDQHGGRDGSEQDAPRAARSVIEVDVARPGAPVSALYGFALARDAGLDIQA